MRRWGFTPQKPLRGAYEENPKEVEAWFNVYYFMLGLVLRADFPGQELRIVCHYAQEEKMREVLVEGKHGGDLHKRTASLLFEKPIDEVSKEEQQIGKACNFLLVYSGTPEGLYRTLVKTELNVQSKIVKNGMQNFSNGIRLYGSGIVR